MEEYIMQYDVLKNYDKEFREIYDRIMKREEMPSEILEDYIETFREAGINSRKKILEYLVRHRDSLEETTKN